MKKIGILIAMLLINSCNKSPVLDCGAIEIRDKLAYVDDQLFTGQCSKKRNGVLLEIQSYKKGEKSSQWERYYENGQLEYIGCCKDNEIHGEYKKYHPNGELKIKGAFDAGFKVGTWTYFDEKGDAINYEEYEN
jgi:antitoxin component YwqK of YwqJK toxin-antitoxin module